MWTLETGAGALRPCLELSPDGRWLAAMSALVGDLDGDLHLWDLVPGPRRVELPLSGIEQPVFRWLAFHPITGELSAMVGSGTGTQPEQSRRRIVTWQPDFATEPTIGPELGSTFWKFWFVPTGSILIARETREREGARLFRWEWPSRKALPRWGSLRRDPRFTACGRFCITNDYWRAGVSVWEIPTDGEPAHLHDLPVVGANETLHPIEPHLLAVSGGTLRLWHLPDTKLLAEVELRDGHDVIRTAFSPDGRWLVAAQRRDVVRILETETWREVDAFRWPVGNITALTFAPDGLRCAVAGDSGNIVVWDME